MMFYIKIIFQMTQTARSAIPNYNLEKLYYCTFDSKWEKGYILENIPFMTLSSRQAGIQRK